MGIGGTEERLLEESALKVSGTPGCCREVLSVKGVNRDLRKAVH